MKRKFLYTFTAVLCLTMMTAGGCSSQEAASSSVSAKATETPAPSASASSSLAAVTPTVDPSTIGEGAAPTDMPRLDTAISREPNEPCTFTADGQNLYTVTINSVAFTDRRAVADTEEPEQVLLVTYSYQSLTDEPVLVDDMSFRCIVNDTDVCTAYYLADQTVAEVASGEQTVTAEVAYRVPADTTGVSLYLTNNSHPEEESFLIHVDMLS